MSDSLTKVFDTIYIFDSDLVWLIQIIWLLRLKIRVVCVGNFKPLILINYICHTKSESNLF